MIKTYQKMIPTGNVETNSNNAKHLASSSSPQNKSIIIQKTPGISDNTWGTKGSRPMNDMRVEPLVTVITLECRDMVEFIPTMQVGNKRERE